MSDNDNVAGGTLQFAGGIDAGSGTVIVRTTDGASLLSGSIQDATAVIKVGTGTLTIATTSVNTYLGATEIREGTLRVDGIIGAATPAETVTIYGGAVLSGSGDVIAAIFSASTASLIRSSGNLRIGDGTADGIQFAGQLIISSGHLVVLRDADLSQLGVLTLIASGARLVATNGVEVGAGEMLSGSGALAGNLVVLAGGQVSPGASVGVLGTDSGNLALSVSISFWLISTGLWPEPNTIRSMCVAQFPLEAQYWWSRVVNFDPCVGPSLR